MYGINVTRSNIYREYQTWKKHLQTQDFQQSIHQIQHKSHRCALYMYQCMCTSHQLTYFKLKASELSWVATDKQNIEATLGKSQTELFA